MINLLITGGCGFIGSNFINYIFDKNNYNIINFDAMYYCASENNVKEEIRNNSRYKLIKGNLCSYDLVNHVINDYKISLKERECYFRNPISLELVSCDCLKYKK